MNNVLSFFLNVYVKCVQFLYEMKNFQKYDSYSNSELLHRKSSL